jgi:anti-anti-sigma factor
VALTPFRIDIESERDDAGLHLKIGCRVDGSTTKEFEAALREAEASDAALILVDLSQVEFMNYKGLSVLYDAHNRWREPDERLRVVACSLQVRNLFAMSGLYDRFMGHRKTT